ncbi:MAG: DUF3772 domain-containing protein [Marinovum sp.]|nr:DUF3772 domain-containing protein [Marinovum sp.]
MTLSLRAKISIVDVVRLWCTAFVAFMLYAAPLVAQTDTPTAPSETADAPSPPAASVSIPGTDIKAWERLAQRAEDVVYSASASDTVYETLRAQVATFRRQFLDAQSVNAARIATLRAQLAALGPTPAAGETENPEVAQRRAALNAQLAEAQAPVRAADEAYIRANGLVSEIDGIIRERQANLLFRHGPSPLDPVNWAPAWRAVQGTLARLGRETGQELSLASRQRALITRGPAIALWSIVGLVLLLRGRSWGQRMVAWLSARAPRSGSVWATIASLVQIVLAIAGIIALTVALQLSGILGLRGTLILKEVPNWAALVVSVLWLSDRLFADDTGQRILPLPIPYRREARLYAALLAVLWVLRAAGEKLAEFDGYSEAARSVVLFPLIFLGALILFRLGRILTTRVRFDVPEGAAPPMRSRFVRLLSTAATWIAVFSPIFAALGYGAAANAMLINAAATLALAGLVLVLQRFCSDVVRLFLGAGEDDENLIMVLIDFALTFAAIPPLALIWGARVTDLTEVWTRLGEGFALGDTRIQPADFFVFVLVFGVLYSATRLLQGALRNSVLPKTSIDQGGQTAIVSGVGYIGVFLAALLGLSSTGLDLTSLAFVAGALSVGIGFGLQNILSNFVSGIILLIERPIAEGDWIEVGGNMGYVRDISVRSTRIQTFDRSDVIVPNADLISGTVTNYTRGNTIGRVIVPVGVAYGTDTRKVEGILMNIARQHDMVLMNPAPSVVFQGFGADSMDFEIRAILRNVNYVLSVKSEMNHQIAEAFAQEGIEIPFAQRDIWLRNPETLTGGAAQPNTDPNGEETQT